MFRNSALNLTNGSFGMNYHFYRIESHLDIRIYRTMNSTILMGIRARMRIVLSHLLSSYHCYTVFSGSHKSSFRIKILYKLFNIHRLLKFLKYLNSNNADKYSK